MTQMAGAAVAALGGLSMGSGAWTLKALRRYRFEHWLLIQIVVSLFVLPWAVTLTRYPSFFADLRTVPAGALWRANLFSLGWGVANALCVVCFVRIGVALTGGVLGGLGIAVGAVTPMVFKASGLFESAPDLWSPAGRVALAGVGVLLGGVALAALAGLRRERPSAEGRARGMAAGLAMAALAGALSGFLNFSFAYGQGPILDAVTRVRTGSNVRIVIGGRAEEVAVSTSGEARLPGGRSAALGELTAGQAARAVKQRLAHGGPLSVAVDTRDPLAPLVVWALCAAAGGLLNAAYAGWVITAGRSWGLLRAGARDLPIPILCGVQFLAAFLLMGKGSLMMGPLGASAGWGIYSAGQILGGQAVGWLSGEWRGSPGAARVLMCGAVAALLAGAAILAAANGMAAH